MIDVIFTKKNFKEKWFKTQDELLQDSTDNFNQMIPEKFGILAIKKSKNTSFFKCFKQAIDAGKGDIVIVSDVGVILNRPLDALIKKFYDEPRLGIIGCKLVSTDCEVVDAGVDAPLKPQPIWRRFLEDPSTAELHNEDNNVYIDAKFILIRKSMLVEVPINPDAMLYWAIFLCWEASRKNWDVLYSTEEVLYTNYFERNEGVMDEMYGESQRWFSANTKPALVKK